MDAMQRYMEQLVDEIRQSAKDKDENIQFNVPTELLTVPKGYEHFPVIPAQKAFEWFRLSVDTFPPAEKWNEKQLLYMCVILRHLFEHYNINVALPNDMPYDMVYSFLLEAMHKYTSCQQEHQNHISFCNGDEDSCPFGKFCATDDHSCDTWAIGYDWAGYWELKDMEDQDKS